MNQKPLFFPFSSPLIHPYITTLFYILTTTTLCYAVDPNYFEACEPKTCGNQSISYPFYIKGIQEPFCGYPGFGLTCDNTNGFPILNLSNTFYTVNKIFYQNHSLRVSSPIFSRPDTKKGCLSIPPTQNLSFPNNMFYLAHNQTEVRLFFGCDSSKLPRSLQRNKIGCSAGNETSWVVALYGDDKKVGFMSKSCRDEVVYARVENGVEGGIQEALRKGFRLNWIASDCRECNSTGGRCGFDENIFNFRCYCTDRVHAAKCDPATVVKRNRLTRNVKLGIGLGIGIPGILFIGFLFLQIYKRKHAISVGHFQSSNSYSDSSINPRREIGSKHFGVPLFSYDELRKATNNFDHTKELGDGGFGTVYFGKLPDGREVAVKRLYEHNYRRVEQFMNEVNILTTLRHKNLVSLYGCTSRHSRELLLVYEYISNGTIASHLHGELAEPNLLPWSIRIKIAIETATALTYLHASGIIHRDVKTSNILLDDNFRVKVADFGLSRLFPEDATHVSTAPQGTPGYLDPEYHQFYQLTSKSDVYSFGVVLIELISSKPAVDINRSREEINLSTLATKKIQESAIDELVDPSLGFHSDSEVNSMIVSVAELAFQCLQRDKELRPSMEEVLDELRRIESGRDVVQVVEEADVDGVGSSHGNVNPSPASPEWDEVGLLKNVKNMKHPSSPNTVTDKWESISTTPNASA